MIGYIVLTHPFARQLYGYKCQAASAVHLIAQMTRSLVTLSQTYAGLETLRCVSKGSIRSTAVPTKLLKRGLLCWNGSKPGANGNDDLGLIVLGVLSPEARLQVVRQCMTQHLLTGSWCSLPTAEGSSLSLVKVAAEPLYRPCYVCVAHWN